MGLTRSMTRHYHVLQICTFVLMTTACASSNPASSNGTATLSWDASERVDLAGHKIYQATAPGAYGAPIAAVPMNVTDYTVTGLESGTTYFFTVTAYNTDGAESSFSNEVRKTIP
ncbi:MAG: fibronectin type III domain-containing protein [Nitrospira sp. CG24B]|nr:MAG: fibronectin type III domain-containing protein [Nitrospira sp. CG24B]